MQAVQIREVGGPEKLMLVDLDLPEPGPGQVRLRIEATGVNFIDTYFRTGLYPAPLPFTPGVEAAGVVDKLGTGIEGVALGDRVAWTGIPGTYASHCLAPATRLVRIPDSVSTELAAATLLQGMTAHYLTHGVRETGPGEVVLVHAAAGGTGGLLVQMLKQAGARVIATCGTEAKATLARESGADEVILYREEDFQSRTRELTDGRGVDVVYGALEEGDLKQRIGGRYALADAAQAHSDLEGRGTIGKLLIVQDED